MISAHSQSVAEQAKLIYSARLQRQLEAEHPNQFVAIEPTSGQHFLADSFSDAVSASRSAHPDRIAFVIRIGHEAAIHLGEISK